MATDAAARAGGRPRPFLLVLLGLAVVAYIGTRMFSGGPAVPPVTSSAPRQPASAATGKPAAAIDPAELDVRIETLTARGAEEAEVERNPFRFQPKPPPPPPPMPAAPPPAPYKPPEPTGPPPPPPIGNTIKFIGIVETGNGRIGAFTDCKASFPGREGEIIEGRYRVVRIQVESAILEYVDGTGRTTLPLNGQACVK
jgi:hypothetical protein